MPTLYEVRTELQGKRKELKDKFDGYALKDMPDGTKARDIPANDIEGIRKLNEDINKLAADAEALAAAAEAEESLNEEPAQNGKQAPVNRLGVGERKVLSLADQLFKSERWKNKSSRSMDEVELKLFDTGAEVKTLMTTGANGYPPEVLRDGSVVGAISRPPQLIDFLRIEPTQATSIKFMKQTVRTNAAAPKAEGAAADEAVITYAEATDTISRIPVHIPATEEQLEDDDEVRSLVENDLILMVKQKMDEQITVGDGNAPNMRGIFNATNIQTQAKGADPVLDAIHKALTKVQITGRAFADLVVLHGNDWQDIVLTRTADGLYILGNPTQMIERRVWGLPVALSEALTEGNGLVLDRRYFSVKMRKDVTVSMTNSHDEDFTKDILRIKAVARAGIKKLRDEAACKVTGI